MDFWHSVYFLGDHGTSEAHPQLRISTLTFHSDPGKSEKNDGQDLCLSNLKVHFKQIL